MEEKIVVVTGASGALGKIVVDSALATGARVAGIDHAASQAGRHGNQIELGGVDLTDARRPRKRSMRRLRISAGSMR